MPRKYHRPPTTKRRKSKKTSSPNVLEPLPESQTDHSAAGVEEEAAEEFGESAGAETYAETEEDEGEAYEAAPAQVISAAKKARPTRHLVADYSYVLTEVRVSIGLAIFLIVALAITAILR